MSHEHDLIDAERKKKLKKIQKNIRKKCHWCERMFTPEILTGGLETHFCSDECRKQYRLALDDATAVDGFSFCPHCGRSFKKRVSYQRFCCNKCSYNYHSKIQRARAKEERKKNKKAL